MVLRVSCKDDKDCDEEVEEASAGMESCLDVRSSRMGNCVYLFKSRSTVDEVMANVG